uniref:Transposon MuDR mudrA n=1 Tax=Solanum tuberosum TaxID=4113 RepID=M1DD05_SOLTU
MTKKRKGKSSEGLGFEEAAQPEEPIVGEVLGRTSASVGEDLGRASAGVGEDLGRASISVGKAWVALLLLLLHMIFQKLGLIGKVKQNGSDWESETEASDDSDNADLSDEGEDEYGSDVHEEVINLRKEKRVAKIKKRKKKDPRSEGVDLGKKGVDLGYDEYLSKKQTTFEGKIAGDEPYFDSDEAVSFEIDTDEDVNAEDEPEMPMNYSIVTGNLGHHKPRSGLKWKGKAAVTQQGLQEMRENKRMRTKSNVAEV